MLVKEVKKLFIVDRVSILSLIPTCNIYIIASPVATGEAIFFP
jgi:hypothetical protein